ncbi:MAG TPA: hypothetical protein VMH33_04015 [Solirubrobacterales bacterium]|nr:hypothetical protein [Solirubrobacterales bacterium]
MGLRRGFITLALLLLAAAALDGVANAETVQSGNVRVSFQAGFSPHKLPRERPAPITAEVEGRISTTDGSQPPPLRTMRVELNAAAQIDARGLPACASSALQSTSSELARERCGPAQVGTGTFEALLQFGGRPLTIDGRALVFNGRVAGHEGMLIHIFIATPVRVALVVPLRISRRAGSYGTVLTTKVPQLVSGFGSITELRLRIGRTFTYRGRRHSYLSAACAAPPGFPGGPFVLARAAFGFPGGRTMHATLTSNCLVRESS